ncbi:MAG: hypothetical protein ACO3O4_12640, partial [bacterium]
MDCFCVEVFWRWTAGFLSGLERAAGEITLFRCGAIPFHSGIGGSDAAQSSLAFGSTKASRVLRASVRPAPAQGSGQNTTCWTNASARLRDISNRISPA